MLKKTHNYLIIKGIQRDENAKNALFLTVTFSTTYSPLSSSITKKPGDYMNYTAVFSPFCTPRGQEHLTAESDRPLSLPARPLIGKRRKLFPGASHKMRKQLFLDWCKPWSAGRGQPHAALEGSACTVKTCAQSSLHTHPLLGKSHLTLSLLCIFI